MADLYHLLDGIEEQQQASVASEDEWDEEDRQELDLPPALAEAARRKTGYLEEEAQPDVDEEETDDQTAKQVIQELPYTAVKKLWSQEMFAPELLAFDGDCLERVTTALRQQEERLEATVTEGMTGDAHMDALLASLLAVDMERTKFLLCDWLKQRLHKIEAHPLHMREQVERMSDGEVRLYMMRRRVCMTCVVYADSIIPFYCLR